MPKESIIWRGEGVPRVELSFIKFYKLLRAKGLSKNFLSPAQFQTIPKSKDIPIPQSLEKFFLKKPS